MGENPSIYTHNRSRESYSIPRKYLSISVCHGCVAHDRHAPMSHIRHGIGNRQILTDVCSYLFLCSANLGCQQYSLAETRAGGGLWSARGDTGAGIVLALTTQ